MSKSLFIAEKPSVAQQFADALKIRGRRSDGYIEVRRYHCYLVCRSSGDNELLGSLRYEIQALEP